MNVKQLIGLAAIVLGGMTSCSNILEEDGVANTITKGETGELRINLVADGSFNITTKSDPIDNQIDINTDGTYNTRIKDFLVTLTPKDGVTVQNLPTNAKYEALSNSYTLPVIGNTYKLTAKYESMVNQSFAWNSPNFYGENTINIIANDRNVITATCTLTNSIVSISTTKLIEDGKITIHSLKLQSDDGREETLVLMGDGVEVGKSLDSDTVFVKAGISPKLILNATLQQSEGNTRTFTHTAKLKTKGNTEPKKQYNVVYELSKDNGPLQIQVSIDGNVSPETIDLPVNPYDENSSQS